MEIVCREHEIVDVGDCLHCGVVEVEKSFGGKVRDVGRWAETYRQCLLDEGDGDIRKTTQRRMQSELASVLTLAPLSSAASSD